MNGADVEDNESTLGTVAGDVAHILAICKESMEASYQSFIDTDRT